MILGMTWGATYWRLFLIISGLWMLTGFGIPESIALATDPVRGLDNTLSHYARSELHVSVATAGNLHTVGWWVSFLAWMMFVVFITAHIWFDQFG
jgi:hypothetical protein